MEKFVTMFIGNVDKSIVNRELKLILQKYGEIHQIQVSKLNKDINLGYAYVKFLNFYPERNILKDKIWVGSKQLKIRPFLEPWEIAQKFDFSNPQKMIFIKGIPPNMTNSELKNFFRKYGEVTEGSAIRPTKKVRSNFYGYVQFKSKAPLKKLRSDKIKLKGRNCQILPMKHIPTFLMEIGVKIGSVSNNAAFPTNNENNHKKISLKIKFKRIKLSDKITIDTFNESANCHPRTNVRFNKIPTGNVELSFDKRNKLFKLHRIEYKKY